MKKIKSNLQKKVWTVVRGVSVLAKVIPRWKLDVWADPDWKDRATVWRSR